MPSERIGSNNPPGAVPTPYARVGWLRDSEAVQLAVLKEGSPFTWATVQQWEPCPDPTPSPDLDDLMLCGHRIDAHRTRPDDSSSFEHLRSAGDGIFDGWWMTLDRAQINDLIRTLRRARDAAFGRDE